MSPVQVAFDLDAYLRDRRERVEVALASVLARHLEGAPSEVADVIRYACEGPAKRIRPILTGAVYDAAGGRAAIEGLACAVEIIHCYSLVHDDLPSMDNDSVRRGKPTAHVVFGPARAARAAAAMIPLAFEVLAEEARALGLTRQTRQAIALDLAQGAGPLGMAGGQVLDLEAEGRLQTPAEEEGINLRKTAALLAAAARIGAHAAGAPDSAVEAFTACGRALGLAFQAADDLLDAPLGPADEAAGAGAGRGRGAGRMQSLAARYSEQAVARLRAAGIFSPGLEALARFAAERDR